jgi:hypothetical protein
MSDFNEMSLKVYKERADRAEELLRQHDRQESERILAKEQADIKTARDASVAARDAAMREEIDATRRASWQRWVIDDAINAGTRASSELGKINANSVIEKARLAWEHGKIDVLVFGNAAMAQREKIVAEKMADPAAPWPPDDSLSAHSFALSPGYIDASDGGETKFHKLLAAKLGKV